MLREGRALIKFENVSFQYEDETDKTKYALNDVSLEVRRGEFVCIIGQNGSGKSTLSKLMNAIYPPTSGKVYVDGMDTTDPSNIWNIRKAAGMVFQNPDNQIVATVVEEDVAFGAENLGVPSEEIKRRVDDALEKVGMSAFRYKTPDQLSGGQKQRVAIAGMLAMEPDCIVFDESTAMLDPSGRREVMKVIESLHSRGMTVVLVTHHMDEAVRADRVFVMDGGTIVMSGEPREIFRRPEELRRLRLDIPFAVYAGLRLAERDIPVKISLTPEELVAQLHELATKAPTPLSEPFADAAVTASGEPFAGVSPTVSIGELTAGSPENDASRHSGIALSKEADHAENCRTAIRVENLTHRYDNGSHLSAPAIVDIHVEIKAGEMVGIIGHTGSGKSTLIQHINGLLKPTEGKITVEGLEIANVPRISTPRETPSKKKRPTRKELIAAQKNLIQIRKKVGLVFQYPEYQLFEETVEKDLMFGPLNLGLPEAEARVCAENGLRMVGLDFRELAQKSPFELSGGQKRRVAIAGVLAMNPDVLILDEPTAGLDPQGRDELLNEIAELHREKRTTILIVSHSMDDMARLVDRILVISGGRMILDGTPKEVFARESLLREVGLDVPEVCKTLRLLGTPKGAEARNAADATDSGNASSESVNAPNGVDTTIIDPDEGVAEIERWYRRCNNA